MGKEEGNQQKKLLAAFVAVTMCAMVFLPMATAGNLTNSSKQKTIHHPGLTPSSDCTDWLLTPQVKKAGYAPPQNPSFDLSDALSKGADYLRHSQADITEDNAGNGYPGTTEIPADPEDGGWDWTLLSGEYVHTSAPSPENTYGVTALGLYYAYLADPVSSYKVAMKDAADYMVGDSGIRTGNDLIFLMLYNDLPGVTGTTYKDAAKAKYDAAIASNGTAGALATAILNRRHNQGYDNGIIPWNIAPWARVAQMLGVRYGGTYAADAIAIADVMYQDTYGTGLRYFDLDRCAGWDPDYNVEDYWWYTLGISGLIDAFAYSNSHTDKIPNLITTLLECRYTGPATPGAFSYCYGCHTDDWDWQSTAYAVMSLANYNRTAYQAIINQAYNWIASTQHTCGGWYDPWNSYFCTEVAAELTSAIYFANGPIKNTNTGKIYYKIQDAIDDPATLDGHTIQVAAGTYHESQITINKALTIQGAGWASTIIDGSDATLTAGGLIRIVATGNVVFTGFTVQNAGGPLNGGDGGDGKTNIGIFAASSSSSATYTITYNKIIGQNNPLDSEDYGLYLNGGQEHVVFQYNILTQISGNSILVETNPGSTDISYNTLGTCSNAGDAIYYMTYDDVNITSLQKISNNTIDVHTVSHATPVTGISFSGAWKGYFLGDPTDTGTYSNVVISDNIITNVQPLERGIAIDNFAWGDGHNGEISNTVIKGNVITGVSTTPSSFAIRLSGYVTDTMILQNTITGCDKSFLGTNGFSGGSTAYPIGTIIHYNVFKDNGAGLIWNGPTQLDARYNYWGSSTGPNTGLMLGTGDHVTGNVLFSPYIPTADWETTLYFSSGSCTDYVVIGEKVAAQDGADASDIPKPSNPPAPFISAWSNAGLAAPYTRLFKDYRKFLHGSLVYDIYTQVFFDDAGTHDITITWSAITTSEYTRIQFLDATNTVLANMMVAGSYTALAVPDGSIVHFKVSCCVNPPVAAPQSITTYQEYNTSIALSGTDADGTVTTYTVTQLPSHGTLWTLGGSQITAVPTITTPSLYYIPALGYAARDNFTFTVTDNDGLISDPAVILITVIGLHNTALAQYWNLVSNPCDAPINKADIIVRYGGVNHSWAQAHDDGKVMDRVYSWDRSTQQYSPTPVTTFTPGEAYWVWAYEPVTLRFPSNAVWSGSVTNLHLWSMMGVPTDTTVYPATLPLYVNYGGTRYAWNTAVSNHYILGVIYGWDRAIQQYTMPDHFTPGEGYWMYSYVDCHLER